jgi:hypothetical protein
VAPLRLHPLLQDQRLLRNRLQKLATMIFSDFLVILVGPALVFVAFILILLAFLAPTVLFHGSVSLLSVASTNLTQAGVEPALFLGPLGLLALINRFHG